MDERTLISARRAHDLLAAGRARAVDVRFELANPAHGAAAHATAHVPGAAYLHLDHDLSDHARRGHGRHPLPSALQFASTLSRIGLRPDDAVIAYDDGNGAHAARLWWMLRALGHARVAVLDGGYAAWVAAGLPVESTAPTSAPSQYAIADEGLLGAAAVIEADALEAALAADAVLLVDARAANRFRGENETIDPVAGHVPGAINRPFAQNLAADGTFKPPEVLRDEWATLFAARAPGDVVLMCGSGVTACHNLLALEHAGLHGARLYADSWSGWIGDPRRPVATGAD